MGSGAGGRTRSRRHDHARVAGFRAIICNRPDGEGADQPTFDEIAEAFAALGAHDAVFGPALDGGYWLVGLRRVRAVPPDLFTGVRWSTEHALSDTVATLRGHSIARVATLRDVDTAADLK